MINLYLYHRLFQIFWCCLLLSHIFHLIDWHKFSDALVGKERLPFVFAILLLPMCIDGKNCKINYISYIFFLCNFLCCFFNAWDAEEVLFFFIILLKEHRMRFGFKWIFMIFHELLFSFCKGSRNKTLWKLQLYEDVVALFNESESHFGVEDFLKELCLCRHRFETINWTA